MSDPKHTPGPWGIEQTDTANWIGPMRPDGVKIAEIVADTDRDGLTDEAMERNDANARLIAAAPELLEALEVLFDEWMHFGRPSTETMEKAESAIAKAKGGAK